jgi:hypothetical protein
MKKRIAQLLAACIALVAIVFLYKNQTMTQAAGTEFVITKPTLKQTEPAGNTTDNQQITAFTTLQAQASKANLSNKSTKDERLSAVENDQDVIARHEATEGVKEEEEDEAPLVNGRRLSKQERINEAVAFEIEKTKDLALGYVPQERMIQAFEQTRRLQADFANKKEFLRGAVGNARWIERGPGNVGGRTRAILVDRGDPSGKTVFAASVTGGIFRNSNITDGANRWERVNDWLDNLTVSSLVQDPRAPKIMYAGTGDTDGNDARGLGIFKSTDAGKTWNVLPSTLSDVFNSIASIVITPDNSTLYAATASGVYRSKNGGDTWEKVLASGRIYNIQLASDKTLYASTTNTIYKSTQGGDLNTWTALTGVGTGWTRTEIAVAPSDPKVLYAVGSLNGAGSNVFRSGDAGATWQQKGQTTWIDGCGGTPVAGDFTRGQAWYDLAIIVDPTNANNVWIGGVDMYRSLDGGGSWTQASFWANCPNRKYAHADHHIFYFDPLDPSVMYSGNDGGVFRVNNAAGAYTIDERTAGYVTTQFYGCAIHADSAVDHFLAGAQDNGTLLMRGKGISNTNGRSIGGDGFLTFIDQDQPTEIQIGSLYGGEWYLSTNNGGAFSKAASSNGGFFCPADYDDKNNILYAQSTTSDLFRWNLNDKTQVPLDLANVRLTNISNIFSDENVKGRVYIGTSSGSLYRVNDANVGTTIRDATLMAVLTGNVASIDVERGNPDHILVTMSNYGLQSVWESKDGGIAFTSCDQNNNLPDMPVRWGMFNPNNGKGALIATNLGVWSTEALNGEATVWQPPVPGRGIPLVRTDRIEWRKSDKMMLAGTYGRGVWTSSVLGKSQAVAEFPPVTYLDVPVNIKGESSISADRFKWLFSDNAATDTLENTLHTFKTVGKFDISLTINNDNALKTTNKIQVLPSLPTPYKSGANVYAGSFEDATSDVHFGAWNTEGSKWERGSSAVPGKSGTHTGSSAFVLEKTANQYKKNTTAYLHTPNFDMSKGGIYQFSFWANYDIQQGYDGFKVEYTLDRGLSWKQLGSKDDADWYNYQNTSLIETAAFGRGESYITGLADEWTRFKLNVSPFAGNQNVAFRFVFKSDGDNVVGSGVAIDDVVLSRYDGKLETAIIAQSGAYDKDGTSINVSFNAQPEYFAQTFTLQKSVNGRVWEDVETVKAKGISSEELQNYPVIVKGTPLDLYYFRVKSVNGDVKSNYAFSFFTQPFAVRRNKDVPLAVNRVFPSPFTNLIGVTFTDLVSSEVEMNLYDDIGRLVATQTNVPNGVYQELKVDNLAKGIYFLTVKIGDGKPETTKLFGAGKN